MASEKKMVLNDNVPVSLLTVRMIMQGKVSDCPHPPTRSEARVCERRSSEQLGRL